MIQQKKSAQQASDLHYKKDYNENVLGAKSHMTADGDLEYVVVKGVKELTDDSKYAKDAKAAHSGHQYAPEFCNTEKYKIAKNITEITSDRYNTTKETLKTMQGWNTIRPGDNPLIVQHAKNADNLNPYLYKEDYEYDKLDCYYPVTQTQEYTEKKALKQKMNEYKDDYEKMKKTNQLDLTKTETYITNKEVDDKYRSDKGYKKDYDEKVKGHCIGYTTTPHMETLKEVKPYQNDATYQKGAKERMQHNLLGEGAPELELAKERQRIRSDKVYKKDYESTKAKNIPGPVENYHDYKAQAEVKAKTNDAAYKADYNESVRHNEITKEFCNTEQYKAHQKIKEIQSNANYSDFPETRAKYQAYTGVLDTPGYEMHARNADNLCDAIYKEDWNTDKELVYFPVQMTEKFNEDKKLKSKLDNYNADYEKNKAAINFDTTTTEKYQQDKKHQHMTSDATGYKEDWRKNVQGTQKGADRTMQMDINDTLKVTKDQNYTKGAKERMANYERSLQDPDYETMSKAQVQRSDKHYKKDYNENVRGHNLGAPIEGHLDYYSQKKVKDITNDAAYTADAKERMKTFILEPDSPFIRSAIEKQKMVNPADYRKSGKEAIETMKGFQQLDIYANPYLNRHIINSENLSDNMYREEYEIDKDCIYYPYNTSEKYSQDKKMHNTVGDLAYTAAHKESDWRHGMDLCTTEKYQQDKKGENFKGDKYKAKYLEDMSLGKTGGSLVHTWEIDAKNLLKPLRDNVYQSAAKEIQRKYDLAMDDFKLSNLMKVQAVQNERLYKAKYDEETKGQGAANPGIAYPWLFEMARLGDKMRPSQYSAEARSRMDAPQNFVLWDEFTRSRKVALSVKDSEYRKSREDAIKSMKGFQQLDIFKNPYLNRHIINSENLSASHYTQDWEEEKDLIYFPQQDTERYKDIKKNQKINSTYGDAAKEIAMRPNFNSATTEKYEQDKKLTQEMIPQNYAKDSREINATKVKGTDKTFEMVRAATLKPYTPTNYALEAKKLAMKYGLTADDNKLAASMLSAKITSDRLYKKHYEENVKGTGAADPGIAYEMSTQRCKKANQQRSDWEYQKAGREAMEHNEYTKQQYTESVKSRLIALSCNDAEYTKGRGQ